MVENATDRVVESVKLTISQYWAWDQSSKFKQWICAISNCMLWLGNLNLWLTLDWSHQPKNNCKSCRNVNLLLPTGPLLAKNKLVNSRLLVRPSPLYFNDARDFIAIVRSAVKRDYAPRAESWIYITYEHDFSLKSRPHEHDCDTLLL